MIGNTIDDRLAAWPYVELIISKYKDAVIIINHQIQYTIGQQLQTIRKGWKSNLLTQYHKNFGYQRVVNLS